MCLLSLHSVIMTLDSVIFLFCDKTYFKNKGYPDPLHLLFVTQWPMNTWRTVPCSVSPHLCREPTPLNITTWWPVPISEAPTATCWYRAVQRPQLQPQQLQHICLITSAPWTVSETYLSMSEWIKMFHSGSTISDFRLSMLFAVYSSIIYEIWIS